MGVRMGSLSDLVFDEPPLVLQRAAVRRFGVLDALVLQQLRYWENRATKSHEGVPWVYKTYQDWSDELGVTPSSVRGALDRLRTAGAVVSIQNPHEARDRTLWWRTTIDVPAPSADSADHLRPAADGTAPGRSSAAPGSSSNAGATEGVQRLRSSTTPDDCASEQLFEGDVEPQEAGRQAAIDAEVLGILQRVPRKTGSKAPTLAAVERARDLRPDRDHVAVAQDMLFWATDGNGARRQIKSVMGTYSTFLKGADPVNGAATAGSGPGNGVQSGWAGGSDPLVKCD